MCLNDLWGKVDFGWGFVVGVRLNGAHDEDLGAMLGADSAIAVARIMIPNCFIQFAVFSKKEIVRGRSVEIEIDRDRPGSLWLHKRSEFKRSWWPSSRPMTAARTRIACYNNHMTATTCNNLKGTRRSTCSAVNVIRDWYGKPEDFQYLLSANLL